MIGFKTQISRTVHVEGDPLLDCVVYTEDKSYGACVENELNQAFTKEIGCIPPLLTENSLVVTFDQTVEVTHSAFGINGQTLLARLGGSVSSGRTLLWLLVTLLGAPQVN